MNQYSGRGNIEFIANLEEISDLADKGYSITLIFNHLQDEQKITIKYGQFYKLFKKNNVKIRKVDAKNLGDGVSNKKGINEKEKKKKTPLRRQEPQSSKLIFENDPDKQSRHF